MGVPSVSVPFDPSAGLIVVPTELLGPDGEAVIRLALDTGATRTLMSLDAVAHVGYDPVSAPTRVRMTTASGVESAPRIVVDKITALGKTVADFAIVCHTLPPSVTVDGLLGLDFFRGQRLIVDFRAGTVTLE